MGVGNGGAEEKDVGVAEGADGTTGVRGWSLVVRVPPPPSPPGGNQENGIEGMITFVSYLTLERAG